MVNKIMVNASTHPAKDNIMEYIDYVNKNNINIGMWHVDIMDGVFVEDKTFGAETVKKMYEKTTIPLDCHLMINEPLNVVQDYIDAGANIVAVHYEAFKDKKDLKKCIKTIKKSNCLAGIAINPDTRVSLITVYLPYIDMVLVTSVVPGKSGQKFILDTVNKIAALKNIIKNLNKKILIEVDGGINIDTVKYVKDNVDMIVCGSAMYNSTDKNYLIKELTK